MKKLLIILTILVYGLSATGATIHLHYCCGKLDKVSLSDDHNKDCPKKGFAVKGCCDSKQVDLKLKADQNLALKWVAAFTDPGTTGLVADYRDAIWLNEAVLYAFTTGPPVRPPSVPLFLKNRVFRI